MVDLLTMVLLVNPTAVELSIWIRDLGCGQPISMSVLRSGIIFLAVMDSAAESEMAALYTTAKNMIPLHNTLI